MIRIIREFSVSWVSKALLILLIGSFGIWGITDFLRPKFRSDVVATVGKETITRVLFYQSLRNEMSRIRSQMGDEIDKNPKLLMMISSQVLTNLIQESLLRQELKNLNLFISDETLKDIVHSEDAFRDENGQFSKKKFDVLLAHQGVSESYYLSMIKKDLQKRFLIKAVIQGVKMPENMLTPFVEQLKETRSLSVAVLPISIFPIVEVPSEEELRSFYDANNELFMLPEVRDLSVVIIDAKTYEDQLKSTEPSLQKEERAEKALGMVYQAGKEIQDAFASGSTLMEISNSMNLPFATIQKVTITGQGEDGVSKIGPKAGLFTEDMLKQAFELGEGNESDLIELGKGRFYIVVVDRIDPQAIPPFERVKDKVIEKYKDVLRMKLALKKAKELMEKLQKGQSLQKIAQENNLSYQDFPNVSFLSPPKNLSEDFLIKLFSQPVGGAAMSMTPQEIKIGQVKKISPNTFKDSKKIEENIKRIQDEFVEDFINQFMSVLQEEFPVEVNASVFEEMIQEN
ncbi:MAG: SurA N-terminal domain-containing protein [Proteobacteria bacterium]|nr:SurA N-terminal domain-containing protein [Pseudomonadota bacterium]